MTKNLKLSELKIGQQASVLYINAGSMTARLRDFGLIKGTKVTCIQKSPLGDPVAFLIRGAVIALRHEDSSNIICEV